MGYTYLFTVFTPTYNRAHTLHRVYEALLAQSFNDFEWVIIDDGSTDNTEELIKQWQKEATFPIHYHRQNNQGKHIASNFAVKIAKGELFLTLDSDDACVPRALEILNDHWEKIPKDIKHSFSGITGLCQDQQGRLVSARFPSDIFDSNSVELRYKHRIVGEYWGFQKTDVMKEFPFPAKQNVFIPEDIAWSAIGRKYNTRFINEVLRIYWVSEDNYSDTLTKKSLSKESAFGLAKWHSMRLNEEIGWFRFAPHFFFISAIHFSRFSCWLEHSLSLQFKSLNNLPAKFLWLSCLPIGLLFYLKDKRYFRRLN